MCHLVQQTAQTGWTSATATAVTFGASSEVIDTEGAHDTGSNTSRIVIGKRLGWWEISGVYCPPSNTATTLVRAIIYKNGVFVPGSFAGLPFASTSALIGITTPVVPVQATSATDYVELFGYQTAASGTIGTAGLNTYVACSLTAIWKSTS
jgi:hypothetical protein